MQHNLQFYVQTEYTWRSVSQYIVLIGQSTGAKQGEMADGSVLTTTTKARFIWLIIRLIQLVFSAGIIFFFQKNQPTVFFSRFIISAERDQKWFVRATAILL
jgi:hypothetical protein